MENTRKNISSLLVSISGIMLFLALAHFIDLNGFTKFSPLLIGLGVLMLFWPAPFTNALSFFKLLTRQVILTIAHILIFVGCKIYFDLYIDDYWFLYLIVGIILLNYHQILSEKISR